jgi:hypothetical protein
MKYLYSTILIRINPLKYDNKIKIKNSKPVIVSTVSSYMIIIGAAKLGYSRIAGKAGIFSPQCFFIITKETGSETGCP